MQLSFRRPARQLAATSLIAGLSLATGVAGCRGGEEPAVGENTMRNLNVPTPPPVPPYEPMAIDPELREKARQVLTAASTDESAVRRAHAAEAILHDPEQVDRLLTALNDRSSRVRFSAAMTAGRMRLGAAMERLKELVEDRNVNVRVAAAYALHRMGDTSHSRLLERTAQDPEPSVRANTAMVLGLLGEPSSVPILRMLARDPDANVRLNAADALWQYRNETGMEMLMAASISQYPDDATIATLAMGSTRDPQMVQLLRGRLTGDYREVQLAAARAMGRLGFDEGYGVALEGAQSSEPRHRLMAAMAFGDIGRTDAQPILAKLLEDKNPDVRLAAAAAILQLREPRLPTQGPVTSV